jgi:uncharacterized sporulation protein YeaH/YhbH (DUF444 family)
VAAWETIFTGNDQFSSGDQINRPRAVRRRLGQGQGQQGRRRRGRLRLQPLARGVPGRLLRRPGPPDLVKTQLARIHEYKSQRAGFSNDGTPANINVVRSLRGALGRRLALGAPFHGKLRELQRELTNAETHPDDDPEVQRLRGEIAILRAKLEAIPFIDTFDLRYNNRIKVPKPTTQAVMFCIMDVSGSMDEGKKATAKRFFMLLYLFLTRTYEHIELVFIRHHTVAKEVNEEDFFHSRESGGTVVSSALELMKDILHARYANGAWNIYGAQASDGDNWENDSPHCRELLAERILPFVQYFAYIEITPANPRTCGANTKSSAPPTATSRCSTSKACRTSIRSSANSSRRNSHEPPKAKRKKPLPPRANGPSNSSRPTTPRSTGSPASSGSTPTRSRWS